ncbi:hypothetical protein BH11BAC4_BH11BAC4_24210 [soil metagenome]
MDESDSVVGDMKAAEVEASYIQALRTNIADGVIELIIILSF